MAATCALDTNTPYKTGESPAVFIVDEQCQKTPMKNPAIYFSYFDSWSDIKIVPQALLDVVANTPYDFVPWGPKRQFGSMSLIKTPRDPKVFLVLGQQKHAVANAAALESFGLSFDAIEDVSESVLKKFDDGSVLKNQYYWELDGFAFKDQGSPKVYRMNNGQEEYIDSPARAALLGVRLDRVATLNRSVLEEPSDQVSDAQPSIFDTIFTDKHETIVDENDVAKQTEEQLLCGQTQTVTTGQYDMCFTTSLLVSDVTLRPFGLSAEKLTLQATYTTAQGFIKTQTMDLEIGERKMLPAFGRETVGLYVMYHEQLPNGRLRLSVITREDTLANSVCDSPLDVTDFDGVVCVGDNIQVADLPAPLIITDIQEITLSFSLKDTIYTLYKGTSLVLDGNSEPVTFSYSVGPDIIEAAGVMYSPTGQEQSLDDRRQARIHIHALR